MGNRPFKEMLVEYIENQAAWRERKAQEYPDDVRNQLCAAGLRDLACYVAALADTDERLVRIAAEHDDAGTGVFMPGDESARTLSRFRFDRVSESFDDVLRRLADTLAEERARCERDPL